MGEGGSYLWAPVFTQEAPLTRKWFSGRSCIRSNWNLERLIFEERGKPENLEKNLSEQSKEPTTVATSPKSNPGHVGGNECDH